LTSYESTVEIIHESLLSAWPRLVQWRNQDEGGALLRDQLRQSAHLWKERGRPEDLLWTGSSYREFAVWRERYPGDSRRRKKRSPKRPFDWRDEGEGGGNSRSPP
jgi:hypothetical protein